MKACRICDNAADNKSHVAREMMFGTRDKFAYMECAQCGCVQIDEVPSNLSKYYPGQYYSFQGGRSDELRENIFRSLIRHRRAEYCLYQKGWIGKLLARKLGVPDYYQWLRKGKVRFDSRILEVGCGTGKLLTVLSREGFTHLTGVDPFIEKDIFYESGVRVLKKEMSQIEETFDFIMMNHAFEHMPDSRSAMTEIYRLLKPNRYALIRIPVASSFAWRKYGVNWVQLDPPRHLFLHTVKSMELLAKRTGFKIADVEHDSHEFQFWGSEQYLRDMPLTDQKSLWVNPGSDFFSKDQIQSFKDMAAEVNRSKDGDQACFYLYK